jgi:hypothetical protein
VLGGGQGDHTANVRFNIATDRGQYTVSISPPAEELIRPNPITPEEADMVRNIFTFYIYFLYFLADGVLGPPSAANRVS